MGEDSEILLTAEIRIEVWCFREETRKRRDRTRVLRHVAPQDRHPSRRRPKQTADHAESCRFARSVRTDYAADRAGVHGEAEAIDGERAAKSPREALCANRRNVVDVGRRSSQSRTSHSG